MAYKHYNLKQSKRKNLEVKSFGGVDFSSQKFNVSHTRAIDSKNFIYRDGVIQKRHGYEQVSKAPTGNFNGIWRFEAEDGNTYTVAHIGTKLYQVSNDLKTFTQIVGGGTYLNKRSFAFVGSNRLWFLGGTKYVVISSSNNNVLKAENVEDAESTFIPTTAIGITYENAKVAHREGLDYPNALSMFRKNTLVSGVGKSEDILFESKYYEYVLDGSLLVKQEIPDVVSNYSQLTDETKRAISKINVIVEERGKV